MGGIGEINFGKQYRQGNRVYSADAVAMACLTEPVGNTGGYSYLYAVRENTNKPLQAGSKGKNSQGYRVYNTDGVSCAMTVDTGGLGGTTGLYVVDV